MKTVIAASAALGFAAFAAYDFCALKGRRGFAARYGFAAGCALWLLTVGLSAYLCRNTVRTGVWGAVCAALAVLSGALLLWALFFSLPQGTYSDPSARRTVYDKKLYALCRHPGFPAFALLCFFLRLWLGPESGLGLGLLCVFNFAYIVLQDRIIFPRIFTDYARYRRSTPFLIPNAESFARCVRQCRDRKDNKA